MKKGSHKTALISALILSAVFYSPINAMLAHLRSTIAQITNDRGNNVVKYQQQLLQQLKVHNYETIEYAAQHEHPRKPYALAELYSGIITALERNGTFPFLNKEAIPVLDAACRNFSETPGFFIPVHTVLRYIDNKKIAKGPLYELEAAVRITKLARAKGPWGERVIGFQIVDEQLHPELTGQFDIVTTDRWIECKNINWQRYPAYKRNVHIKRLEDQFRKQQAAVERYNDDTGLSIDLEVVSKQPIPEGWQEWFAEQGILCRSDNVRPGHQRVDDEPSTPVTPTY